MIIKFEVPINGGDNGWYAIDGVSSCNYHQSDLDLRCFEGDIDTPPLAGYDGAFIDHDAIDTIPRRKFLEVVPVVRGEQKWFITNTTTYLLSDTGKTIERIN